MADRPWRCSACGTINEPVANSCRSCGRWPSLFDLEASVVDDAEVPDQREPAPTAGFPEPAAPAGTDVFEPETFEPPPAEPAPWELEDEDEPDEPEAEGPSRRRRLASFLVPLAFVVYLVLSALLDRG
jgi:hypothetical protein